MASRLFEKINFFIFYLIFNYENNSKCNDVCSIGWKFAKQPLWTLPC